jgi:hypothetical protein
MQLSGVEVVLNSDGNTPLVCTKQKAEVNSGCSSDVEVVEAVTRQTGSGRIFSVCPLQ